MSYNRTTAVLVGDGSNSALYSALTTANIAEGDIAVTNKFGTVLVAGATPSSAVGNDEIKIIQGIATGRTRKSNIIQAHNITKYTLASFVAPTQKVVAIGSNGTTGSITAVNNTRYKLRIEFRTSTSLLPNQASAYEVYYDSDATATHDEIATGIVAKVNADKNLKLLISAAKLTEAVSLANSGIQLTGKAVPANSIDRYEFANFDAFFTMTPNTSGSIGFGVYTAAASTIATTTAAAIGTGSYGQIFDLWKDSLGDSEGYGNFTLFPVEALPAGGPVLGATYDLYSIHHFNSHPGPGIHNEGRTPELTVIAVAAGSAQGTALAAVLDPYMSALGKSKD